MHVTIPYGSQSLDAALEGVRLLDTLDVADTPAVPEVGRALTDGLEHPIGRRGPLADALPPAGTVLITVSDAFRTTGADALLPPLLDYLAAHGVAEERIAFLFATGTHRPPTEEEQAAILGRAVYDRFQGRIHAHDPHDRQNLVFQGTTSRRTPVYINRLAAEAACVIVTGTVVLHYFGGFGGGRKGIVPGIAGMETIAANHSLNLHPVEDRLHPDVAIGRTRGNPVSEDMEEAAALCGDLFLVNTVLNRAGRITGLFCGDLGAAHDAACTRARDLFTVPVRERADLVIASAGAAKNFVQSHKALYNAFQAMKPGGRIILAAAAPEGFGGSRFTEWVALGSREAIIAQLRKSAEINGQTALSTIEKAPSTVFITELSARDVERLGGRKAVDLRDALAVARSELAAAGIRTPTCYVMPAASYTVPRLDPPPADGGVGADGARPMN